MYPTETEKPSLLTNKKFLLIIAIVAVIILIFLVLSLTNNTNNNDENVETYSADIEEYLYKTETYARDNHPISTILPIINEDPQYVISYDSSWNSDNTFSFVLTIEYATPEALSAAKARLNSDEFSAYDLSNYKIVETQISN